MSQLNQKFAITDSRDANWILGCWITRDRTNRLLMIDQEQFTIFILQEFSMEHCNVNTTPCPKWCPTSEMSPQNEAEHEAASLLPYLTIVRKCMYLSTYTHPDISFAVQELARFMSNYGQHYFAAAKHLLKYLQGTCSRSIIYQTPNPTEPIFKSFSDSDWAMCKSRKSISGFIIECSGGPISWSSKQQPLVALSTCKAEYLACSYHMAPLPLPRTRVPSNKSLHLIL